MKNSNEITIIIGTMAEKCRANSLQKAIQSIRFASSLPNKIIVVVNGSKSSDDVIKYLRNQKDIQVVHSSIASLPHACLTGRHLVKTKYYSFLDDDDEYLPGGLDDRVELLCSDPDYDFVVSNGFRNIAGDDITMLNNMSTIRRDPMKSLLTENWLASCGGLFRSDKVGVEYFEDYHKYLEWTWLAFKLVLNKNKFGVLDKPTFRINDTPSSASKSWEYFNAANTLYKRMLSYPLPKNISQTIRQRIGDWLHEKSDRCWKQGNLYEAWLYHIKSLVYPGGSRHLSFSWRLFTRHRDI